MLEVTVYDQASGASARFEACADEPLLDQLERECTFNIPNLCWNGACGTCALRVACGIEHLEKDAFGIGATIDVGPDHILPCAAGARETAIEVADLYYLRVEVA